MQDRGGEPRHSSFPQQVDLDGGFLNAVVAERSPRCFLGGGNLDTRPVDPDGAAVKKMLKLAAKRFHQVARAFNGKADQIDHHVGTQITDLLSELTRKFFCGAIHFNVGHRLPGDVLRIGYAFAPADV
jgi:hypothetical protein